MNKKLPLVLIFSVAFIFLVRNVSAHCLLCAMGAGAAAVGAVHTTLRLPLQAEAQGQSAPDA